MVNDKWLMVNDGLNNRHCGLDPQSTNIYDKPWGYRIKCGMTVFESPQCRE